MPRSSISFGIFRCQPDRGFEFIALFQERILLLLHLLGCEVFMVTVDILVFFNFRVYDVLKHHQFRLLAIFASRGSSGYVNILSNARGWEARLRNLASEAGMI